MASSSQVASVSHPSSYRSWKYDVFLSFRGRDTRKGITVDIYNSLIRRGIKTFMDNPDLKVGDAISPTLLAAIRGSRIAIVVLSRNYASSSWCLEELEEICECMKDNNRILPLFYKVEPSDVRYQKKSFEEAFSNHEISGRHESEKVVQWRAALYKVANFSGWNTEDYKTHKELVNVIVEFVCSKLVPDVGESIEGFEAYEATRQARDELLKALKDEDVTAIGVYGMGGVGKTTLAEHVGAQAKKSGIFDHVIKCVVSQNPNIKQIQGTLSDFLGIKLEEETEDGRAARLGQEIRSREKLLIILDDVWGLIELAKIGIPNFTELENCSSKILLTTRSSDVCHKMECHKKIILNILSEEDSWTLFVRKARCSFESTSFESVARKVAGECKGLPIALITVARALGNKDLEEWKRAAQRLEKSQSANYADNGEAFECIKLSYDYLKDEECKSFFLLCCLFPEDYDIEIDQVFKYGMGIGLFQDAETLKEGQGGAISVANHLKNSSLLLESYNSEHVRLHDVIRDAAIRIAKYEGKEYFVRAGCGLKQWPLQKKHDDFTAISLKNHYIRKLPEKLVCPKLQILLLDDNNIKEIPETFFQSPNDLRVLDLSVLCLSLLPRSISLLTNLTFLSLLGCEYLSCDTSTLGNLKKLEILYLKFIDLKGLSIELRGLTNLRIFCCYDAYIGRIPAGVISEWKDLEELHIQGFGEWGCEVEGKEGEETTNASFQEVIGLSKLRVLKTQVVRIESLPTYVDLVSEWVEFDITVGLIDPLNDVFLPLSHHQSIKLFLNNISDLPEWFRDELMKGAEYLHWIGCENLSDIFVDLEHGRLPKLRHLHMEIEEISEEISEDELKQSLMDEIGESFKQDESRRNPIRIPLLQNLEKLTLGGLSLEDVHTLSPGSLLNLKKLKLHGCYSKGNSLISLAKLQILPNLETIEIHGTRQRYIFGHDVLVVSLPLNIRMIELRGRSIIGICEGRAPPTMFQNLQSLVIYFCDTLEGSLFTHEVAQCLPQLDYISLDSCLLLERIVEAGNNKTILPKLSNLTLHRCPLLYCESGSLDIECPSLEMFYLEHCPQFAASFDDFNSRKQQKPYRYYRIWRKFKFIPPARRIKLLSCSIIGICEGRAPRTMFQNFQSLDIIDCCKLEGSLFTHEVAQCLPQLDILGLGRCPLLERIVEAGNNKTILPKLRHLSLEKCPVLFCGSGSLDIECPSLEMFNLSECPKFAASFDDFNSRKQQKPYMYVCVTKTYTEC